MEEYFGLSDHADGGSDLLQNHHGPVDRCMTHSHAISMDLVCT